MQFPHKGAMEVNTTMMKFLSNLSVLTLRNKKVYPVDIYLTEHQRNNSWEQG